MKLTTLKIDHFRSIESISLSFPSYYTAVSGKNNSGKSNLLRALKVLFAREPDFHFRREEAITHTEDSPIWRKGGNQPIRFSMGLSIDRARDSSVFKLAKEFFSLAPDVADVVLTVSAEYMKDKDQPELAITHEDVALDSYKSRTLLKTIKSAGAFQFHNSTEMDNPFDPSNFLDLIGDIGKTD